MEQTPPTYEDYTAAPSGSSLLEVEDGLTLNQRRGGNRFSSQSPLSCLGENISHHLGVLYVLWFVAFVIACNAMHRANVLAAGGSDGGGRGGGCAPPLLRSRPAVEPRARARPRSRARSTEDRA